ncbi:ankyrin repeat-containing domain protein [Mycena galericulata]|nr:ankyrin repeat-containing domain protein [Mycena galericulata]
MADQHDKSLTLSLHGGTGGPGGSGQSGGYGGAGGPGHGPTLKVEAGTVHIVINHSNRKEEKDIPRQDFINWLSPINFFPRQADILQLWQEGTGEWLLADPGFQAWKTGSIRTLWCHGIRVACIYLDHKEENDQTPSKLLAALWRQLVLGRDVGSTAKNLYVQHKEKGTAPSLKEVLEVLSSSLEMFSKVFFVIDAIDEYPDYQRCILLKNLADLMGHKVNLMVTSRPHVPVPEDPPLPNVKTLQIHAMPKDIRKYVDAQIDLSPHLPKHMQKKPQLRENIHKKITDTVDGMFLLAKLHIESLSTKLSVGAIQEALEELPKNLHDTYNIAMHRIEAQTEDSRRTARSTLIWVANAKRPLRVSEITAALAIKPGARSLNEDYLIDIETILSVCAGLVTVDKQSVLRLVHYTTQEYLDKIQAKRFPDAQTEITCTLLTFLCWPRLHLLEELHLAKYSQYCLAHAAGQPEVQLRKTVLEFLGHASHLRQKLFSRGDGWENGIWNCPPWNYLDWPSQPSALWIAAAANLVETAKFLLFVEGAPWIQCLDRYDIIVASYYGHLKMVQLLIDNGADVNAQGGIYKSALGAALFGGNTEMVEFLMDQGAHLNSDGENPLSWETRNEMVFGTALQVASVWGQIGTVQFLLQQKADINGCREIYGTALQTAALTGNLEVVQLLLDRGANVNAEGGQYGTALQAASYAGQVDIAEVLLKSNPNVNANVLQGDRPTALQAALYGGHTFLAQLLLQKGADVHATGGHYPTALQAALYGGHRDIAQLLLDQGADVNAQEGGFPTALQAACYAGYEDIIHQLLEKGANVNSQVNSTERETAKLQALKYNPTTLEAGIIVVHGGKGGCAGKGLHSDHYEVILSNKIQVPSTLELKEHWIAGSFLGGKGGSGGMGDKFGGAGGNVRVLRYCPEVMLKSHGWHFTGGQGGQGGPGIEGGGPGGCGGTSRQGPEPATRW